MSNNEAPTCSECDMPLPRQKCFLDLGGYCPRLWVFTMSNNEAPLPECMMPDGGQACEAYQRALERIAELETALLALVDAEWMVTHDWGGNRDELLEEARGALKGLGKRDNE